MNGEVEAAGAAVTAGLIASQIERPGAHAGKAHGACANCGAALAGKFCHSCGQPAHIHRSLGHLFEEALHGILHFDTKAWRTLPLLFLRPGTLTRNYIEGRRARYISPLALFLFTVFLMFFVFAFLAPRFSPNVETESAEVQALRADVQEAEEERATAREKLEQAGTPPTRAFAEAMLARNEARLAALNAALDAAAQAPPAATAQVDAAAESTDAAGVSDPAPARTWQEQWRQAVRSDQVEINMGDPALEQKVLKRLENPDLVLYKLQQTAYKFSWLLVPLSLPLVWLLFLWRRGTTGFDHGVFTLYSLSFVSLLVIVAALMLSGPEILHGLAPHLFWAIPAHQYFQLKGAYQLSWFSALWRTAFLMTFSFFALLAFVLSVLAIGLLG